MKSYGVIRSERDVEVFIREVELATKEIRDEVAEDALTYMENASQTLVRGRMPSGDGGSYGKSFHKKTWSRAAKTIARLYNNHPWAFAVEWGTPPRTYTSSKQMHIDKVIPPLGTPPGSRDINSVPYGTKYVPANIKTHKVVHPGSRAFYIFTDTFKALQLVIDNIIENITKKAIP